MTTKTMTSAEMNEAIWKLDDEMPDKPVPYMGWAWREVDFDAPDYRFGVMPANTPSFSISTGIFTSHGPAVGAKYVAFMENNKWGYPVTRPTTPEEWAHIKSLIVKLIDDHTEEAAARLQAAIQAIAEGQDPEWEPW